jgi:hypothetical protein
MTGLQQYQTYASKTHASKALVLKTNGGKALG